MRNEPALPAGTVLVTGGSRGIGAATALLCARRGWAVAVNYARDAAAAEAVVASIHDSGGTALAVHADVADDAAVVAMFERLDRELPPLAGLVNNAGVIDLPSRVEAMSPARLQRMFSINVFGSFYCAREAIRRMSTTQGAGKGGRGGAIVNVSSAAAKLGAGGQYVDYAASKGAIDSLTVGLAREVAQEGIRVNAVRPGVIYTEIHASGGEAGRVDRVKAAVPMRRGGEPEEVARAILWLLSDDASYSTGTFIDVSGGR